MKVSEIIQLIGAGYTKEEIAALEAQQEPVAAPADPTPSQDLLDAIRTLTAAVQHNNKIMTPQPDNIVPDDVQKQADEILTKFCNT